MLAAGGIDSLIGFVTRVQVKGISRSATDKVIAKEFEEFGEVQSVYHGDGLDWCFVIFTDPESMAAAAEGYDVGSWALKPVS